MSRPLTRLVNIPYVKYRSQRTTRSGWLGLCCPWRWSRHWRHRPGGSDAGTCPDRRSPMTATLEAAVPLTAEEMRLLGIHWRAANYLSVGRLYLLDHPLPAEPFV